MLKESYPYKFLFIVLSVFLILIAGLRPLEYFRDTIVYLEIIKSTDVMLKMEPTIYLVNYLNQVFFGGYDQGFFIIYAAIGVSIKVWAIKKTSLLPFFSMYLYVCLYFILHEMTQIRVGVASGLFLLSLPDLLNKNYKAYFLKTILAISFHFSAVLMFFMYFIKTDKVDRKVYFLLPLLGMLTSFFPELILDLMHTYYTFLPEFLGRKVGIYLSLMSDENHNKINIFNSFMVSLVLFYYFMFFNLNRFRGDIDNLLFKMLGIQIFVFYFFSFLPTFAFRISEFIGVCIIITIPSIICVFKEKLFPLFMFSIWAGAYFWFVSLKLLNI